MHPPVHLIASIHFMKLVDGEAIHFTISSDAESNASEARADSATDLNKSELGDDSEDGADSDAVSTDSADANSENMDSSIIAVEDWFGVEYEGKIYPGEVKKK